MLFGGKKATVLLFIGDAAVFVLSLWVTLFIRYRVLPTQEIWALHAAPFGLLFCAWLLVFYMAGLYGKQVVRLESELWGTIVRTQIFNIILAALFFFLIPFFGIAPKTNLGIYLVVSLAGILLWRLSIFPGVSAPGARVAAALVGTGPEVDELVAAVNANPRYPFSFEVIVGMDQLQRDFSGFVQKLEHSRVALLVVDAEHDATRALLPKIYRLIFGPRRYQFANFYAVYEEVFDRVPLSLLRYDWFLKNVSLSSATPYAVLKRLIDLIGGILMGFVTLIIAPFVWIGMKLEGPGPLFIEQERIGKGGVRVRTFKFRTMERNDRGEWIGAGGNRVTKLGGFLRRISLDEFPQFINVLRGELSLIGPRNDIAGLAERLAAEIPYYNVRYVVKPGITGWAQINQQYEQGNISPQSVAETKVRLAYDFYYIKNRSLALDLIIALKTFKRMLFRVSPW